MHTYHGEATMGLSFVQYTSRKMGGPALLIGVGSTLPMQSAKVMLNFVLSFQDLRRPSLLLKYLVIAAVPFFTWAQDSLSHEQAIRPMHVQKNTERFSNGKPKVEYSFYRGKDGVEVLHGRYITWSESGQKESSCNYLHGEKEGLCFWWNDQGKLADSVEYIHGKPRAIAEWEARDQRTVKTPIYLYPYIVVL